MECVITIMYFSISVCQWHSTTVYSALSLRNAGELLAVVELLCHNYESY